MFARNLHEVYYDIYQLVRHVGFDGEYVDNMCPADRELYKHYYIVDSEESPNTSDNAQAARDVGLDIEDLL